MHTMYIHVQPSYWKMDDGGTVCHSGLPHFGSSIGRWGLRPRDSIAGFMQSLSNGEYSPNPLAEDGCNGSLGRHLYSEEGWQSLS